MASFKQIMALCLDGASYAQISSALGCSNRDISRVKNVIEADGITRDVFNELPPGWFSDRFADGRSKRRMVYDQPDFKALADKLKNNKHLTRHKLWMDYLATPADTDCVKYQYSQFCDRLREFLQAHDLVEVIEHVPVSGTVCGLGRRQDPDRGPAHWRGGLKGLVVCGGVPVLGFDVCHCCSR